ncbi:hypothetical protein FRC06_007608, partial [Ceratobasidium sp. 370]
MFDWYKLVDPATLLFIQWVPPLSPLVTTLGAGTEGDSITMGNITSHPHALKRRIRRAATHKDAAQSSSEKANAATQRTRSEAPPLDTITSEPRP